MTAAPRWADVFTTWEPTWVVDVVVLVLAVAYAAGVVRRRRAGDPWPAARSMAFGAALVATVVTFDSGIGVYAHGAFAVHMVQHLMLIMVVPVLWVAGMPLTLLRTALPASASARLDRVAGGRVGRAIAFPATGFLAYALVVVLTHLTGFMDTMAGSVALHRVEQLLYLGSGLWFFAVAVGVDALPRRPSYAMRFVLMMLAMGVDTLVGLVLLLSPHSPFAAYGLADVRAGGAIMWAGGDGLMMLVIVALGRRWVAESGRIDFGPWLESARRSALADATGEPERPGTDLDVDDDRDDRALAAYNRMLARLNEQHPR